MPNTTELEREILHAHPHEQELVHHVYKSKMPSMELMLVVVAIAALAMILALIIAFG